MKSDTNYDCNITQDERLPPPTGLRSGRRGQAPPAAEVRPATPPAPASRPAHTVGGPLTGARGLGTVRLRAARPSVAQSVPVLGGVQGPFGAFRVLPPHTTFPRAGRRGGAKASRGAREPQMATVISRNEGHFQNTVGRVRKRRMLELAG